MYLSRFCGIADAIEGEHPVLLCRTEVPARSGSLMISPVLLCKGRSALQ